MRVPLIDASGVSAQGSFFLNLSNAANAVIGDNHGLATIVSNTIPSGTPVMAISNPVVDAAAGVVSFAVTLNQPSTGTVTVNYTTAAGTDTAGDFVPVSGTLAFAPGDMEKTVTVLLTNVATTQQAFNLVLSDVSGATLPDPVGTALIGASNLTPVNTPLISATALTVGEGDAYAEFVVRLSAPSASIVTVNYGNSNGTAANGTEYLAISGTLAFAPGQTVQTVRVPLLDPASTVPAKGNFFFNLSSPTNGIVGTATTMATIISNTPQSGTPVMVVNNPVVDATAGLVTFAVTLNQPSTGLVTVNYATAPGSDTASDFILVSGILAFAPGDTAKSVTVPLVPGANPQESFNLVLSDVAGATLPNAVGTAFVGATNLTTVNTPVISTSPITVGEGDGYAEFVVRLNEPSASVVTVNYGDSNGTAANGTEYLAVSGTLVFAPGQTVQTVRVPLLDPASTVPAKGNFFFNLSSPTNAVVGTATTMATVIANTAPSGTPVISISNPVVDASAATVTFAVTLSRPGTGTVTANYTTAAGSDTSGDFVPTSGTLVFVPGDTAKTVTVLLNSGSTALPQENFNLVLSDVVGATLPNAIGTALIGPINQTTVNTPVISTSDVTVNEADGYAELVVRLSAPMTSLVTVNYSDTNGTAISGTDYLAVSGTLTFAPGQTVQTLRVPIIDHTASVAQKTFSFNLSTATNATIASSSTLATETILYNVVNGPRTLTWNGTTDSSLANAANWSDITNSVTPAASAPTGTDTVVFGAGSAGVSGGISVAALTVSGNDTVLLTSGASLAASGAITVGDGAAAALTIESGAELIGGSAVMAATGAASGSSVDVTGAGSSLSVTGSLIDGNAGFGLLSIAQGAVVTAASIDEASAAGGDGVISVAGTGSALTLTGSLTVGDQGAGEVSVLNGATVSALDVTIGNASTLSSGNVDVEGAGSELFVGTGGVLNVGVAGGGSGVLTIGAGTTLHSNAGVIEAGHASFNNNGGVVDPPFVDHRRRRAIPGLGSNLYDLYVENIGAVQIVSGTGTWDTPMLLTGTSVADAQNNIDVNGDQGEWQLSSGGTLIVNANTVDSGQAIVFEDATDTLVIGQIVNNGAAGVSGTAPVVEPGAENLLQAGGFAAAIWGYQTGDDIDFANMTVSSASVVNGNTVDLFGPGDVSLGALAFFTKSGSKASDAGAAAAALQIPVQCFAEGTRIETVDGPVRVEDLTKGDRLVTAGWIVRGHRVDRATHGELPRASEAGGGVAGARPGRRVRRERPGARSVSVARSRGVREGGAGAGEAADQRHEYYSGGTTGGDLLSRRTAAPRRDPGRRADRGELSRYRRPRGPGCAWDDPALPRLRGEARGQKCVAVGIRRAPRRSSWRGRNWPRRGE